MSGSKICACLALAPVVGLALAACSNEPPPPPGPPYAALTTGQAAQVVIGQADFTSGQSNPGGGPAGNTLAYPTGNPAVVDGRLYAPDEQNNRVLGFDTVPVTNGAAANFVLGQPDMSEAGPGCSPTGLHWPGDVSSSAGKLVLADRANSRILVWNVVPASTDVPADVVVGMPTMFTSLSACSAASTAGVVGAHTADGRLIVADYGHHRVLVWNSIPTTSGQPADLVLGQPDFTTCEESWPATATTLRFPTSVWSDGTRLLVADYGYGRLLLWHTFPTASGQPPDLVFGKPDFTSSCSVASASCVLEPIQVTSNGTQVAVADLFRNRVLLWNAFPTTNGASADVVLGQTDFDSTIPGTTATGLWQPNGVLLHADMLIVADNSNSRYLVYR